MKINLCDFYPQTCDGVAEVPDAVGLLLRDSRRRESNERRRAVYHKAYFSLDRGDGIERSICAQAATPETLCEQAEEMGRLRDALASLSEKQRKRIYAHYFLGVSKTAIARAEGVSESSVFESIDRGLRRMKKILKNPL